MNVSVWLFDKSYKLTVFRSKFSHLWHALVPAEVMVRFMKATNVLISCCIFICTGEWLQSIRYVLGLRVDHHSDLCGLH